MTAKKDSKAVKKTPMTLNKSLPNGTKPTGPDKIRLAVAEVCLILETGHKTGVSELKFGDLCVKFGRTAGQEVQKGVSPLGDPFAKQPYPYNSSGADLSEKTHDKLSRRTLEDEELRMREEQMAHLLITDPLKYEELLSAGELSDDMESTGHEQEESD